MYTLNHYNNAFTWNPGAIGFHIESASAYDPRGGTNWSANAVINGITVTGGTMSEPLLGGLGHPDAIFRNLFEGANVGDAVLRNTKWLKWTLLNIGDPLYRPFPAGIPAVKAPQNSLALTPQYLIGGKPSTGTITLAAPAPAGGIAVSLKSSATTVATVPATVTIASRSDYSLVPNHHQSRTGRFAVVHNGNFLGLPRSPTHSCRRLCSRALRYRRFQS